MVLHPAVLMPAGVAVMMALATCIAPVSAQTGRTTPVRATPAAQPAPVPAPPAPARIELESDSVMQGDLLRGRITPPFGALTLNAVPIRVGIDGGFIIGIDRDAQGEIALELTARQTRATGPVVRRLAIQPRPWAIQHINAPSRGAAASDAEFERRRPGELAQMAEARRTVVTSDGWRQDFIWPVRGGISGVFGSQRVYRGTPGSFHNGVDVAVPTGTPFVAPADGVVILAATQPFTLEGYLLMVDHGSGLSSTFLHASRLDVQTGDVVRQGQRLGAVGATGRTTGPHLHWAMRWNGAKIDAQRVAGPMR